MIAKTTFYMICTLFLLGCQNLALSRTETPLPNKARSPTDAPAVADVGATDLPVGVGGAVVLPAACAIPAGWEPYQMQVNETVHSVAARAGLTGDDVLAANCQTNAAAFGAGSWLYVPPAAADAPAMLLPLGIMSIAVDPATTAPGETVTLYWQSQGPVINVRAGWWYRGEFMEVLGGLPAGGAVQVVVPDDGRDSHTLMVRATDGVHESIAQISLQVRCAEGWFFAPVPQGCPLPPLVTAFEEQAFERGAMVYIPALDVVYVFANSQPGKKFQNAFQPGMALNDPGLNAQVPVGLRQPAGPFYYAWLKDETLRNALGWATGDPLPYMGMGQAQQTGGAVYLSAGGGHVYLFREGGGWSLISPE